MMFPAHLLEERITWDEFVKRKGYAPERAFRLYRAIKFMFACKNQELPDGVAYFREKGWEETVHRAVEWYNQLMGATFEDWA
ncbi:hypothetical protein IJJ27_04340 [bacterium]|nr:hypothetical protein [bacterium]